MCVREYVTVPRYRVQSTVRFIYCIVLYVFTVLYCTWCKVRTSVVPEGVRTYTVLYSTVQYSTVMIMILYSTILYSTLYSTVYVKRSMRNSIVLEGNYRSPWQYAILYKCTLTMLLSSSRRRAALQLNWPQL